MNFLVKIANHYRRKLLVLLPATLLVATLPSLSPAEPFTPGEKLSYMISWSFIPAGRATLEIAPPGDGAPSGAAYHFIMTAHTLPAVALFYPYQERIDSFATQGVGHSLLYKKFQESGHPRDIVVTFDWQNGTAQYSNFGQANTPIPIPPDTQDPLSALYYIRLQQLRVGTGLERPVTDGKKLSLGRARILKRETIAMHGRRYQTIKIEPDLREVKGVFEKSPGASMFIWLTDDSRRLLVRLKSKVKVGSFIAELLESESVIPGYPAPSEEKKTKSSATVSQPWENTGSNRTP